MFHKSSMNCNDGFIIRSCWSKNVIKRWYAFSSLSSPCWRFSLSDGVTLKGGLVKGAMKNQYVYNTWELRHLLSGWYNHFFCFFFNWVHHQGIPSTHRWNLRRSSESIWEPSSRIMITSLSAWKLNSQKICRLLLPNLLNPTWKPKKINIHIFSMDNSLTILTLTINLRFSSWTRFVAIPLLAARCFVFYPEVFTRRVMYHYHEYVYIYWCKYIYIFRCIYPPWSFKQV